MYSLVTGAGGTVGSALCKRLDNPLGLGRGENSMLHLDCQTVLGDVRDERLMREVFEKYYIREVYHCAAHKHVSFCESNVNEAVSNNITGTQVLARIAKEYQVKKFVYMSTDKAVEPINVYGFTKRLAELIVLDAGYTVVRSGNVWGSRGSVVPKWKEQIENDYMVTLTDPDVTRWFIAVAPLADYIASVPPLNRVFIPYDLMQKVSMLKLAQAMGARGFDIIGLQKGEKLHEKLKYDFE